MKKYLIAAVRGRNPDNPSERKRSNANYRQFLEINDKEIANTLTSVGKDNYVIEIEYGKYSKEDA